MGGGQSIFYPDNGHRHDRAQQLADDCQDIQNAYNQDKTDIQAELGPYKEKLDKVLLAFGCNDIDQFDEMMLKTATGDALARWDEVRSSYDKSQQVDQMFMVAEGTVLVAGLTISIVGAAAGGIGFFAGLAVTADVLLVLGVLGAIFDIVDGAIQRGKLRDAINSLFESRIKAKYVQEEMDQLKKCVPSIKLVYETYEQLGYDQAKILQKFKDHNWVQSLQNSSANITYDTVGQELADQDSARGSWTNEDPDWHSIVSGLDADLAAKKAAETAAANAENKVQVAAPLAFRSARVLAAPVQSNNQSRLAVKAADLNDVGQQTTVGQITIHLANAHSPLLKRPLKLKLSKFENQQSASVSIYEKNNSETLMADVKDKVAKLVPAAQNPSLWTVSLIDAADTAKFSTAVQKVKSQVRPDSVRISLSSGGLYLNTNGELTEKQDSQTEFSASYA